MAKEKSMGALRRASGAAANYKAKNYLFAIAINDYEHIDKLNNCVSDAEAVIELLTEDFEFEREEVCFICSGQLNPAFRDVAVLEDTEDETERPAKATRSVIMRQLRNIALKIKEDQKEDPELKVNLILYYSGHGWYDDFLDQGYWIPVDSELDDYSKYISNGTIQDFLNGIPTHHTLLLSDSCFSGSLFATGTGKSIASTRLEKDPSRWGITAGRNEVVSDGAAGQQSPFIESFLTELRAADTIAVQDLSTKILERVASNDKQTPRGEPLRVRGHKGGQFVFRKKANAQKHYEAGHLILRLAHYQPEYARFRAAANQFMMARRLTKKQADRAEYLLWEVRALAYAGLPELAIETYDKGIKRLNSEQDLTALQEQITALKWLREPDLLGEKMLHKAFATTGNWSERLIELYRKKNTEKRTVRLVLVAVNEYQGLKHMSLNGCINDAELLETQLLALFEKPNDRTEIVRLFNEEATKDNIVHTLTTLQADVRATDAVFVYFAGHANTAITAADNTTEDIPYIIPHDSNNKLSHRELHQLFQDIPCPNKTIIMDVDNNAAFYELAKSGNYALLQGGQVGERIKELRMEGKTHGVFSYVLTQALDKKNNLTAEQKPLFIAQRIAKAVKGQQPAFMRATAFFSEAELFSYDADSLFHHLLTYFYGARNPATATPNDQLFWAIDRLGLDFSADAWQRLADLLPTQTEQLRRINYYEQSLALYQAQQLSENRTTLLRLHQQLASLYGTSGRLSKAEQHLMAAGKYLSDRDQEERMAIKQRLAKLAELSDHKKYALLVDISKPEKMDPPEGRSNHLQTWKEQLLELGYEDEHIITLKDAEATADKIAYHFRKLADRAATHPGLFFYSGPGTRGDLPDQLGLIAHPDDADDPSVVLISKLADWSKTSRHLTVVLDTDFSDEHCETDLCTESGEKPPAPLFGNLLLLPGGYDPATGKSEHRYFKTKEHEVGALGQWLLEGLKSSPSATIAELSIPDHDRRMSLAGEWLPEEDELVFKETR